MSYIQTTSIKPLFNLPKLRVSIRPSLWIYRKLHRKKELSLFCHVFRIFISNRSHGSCQYSRLYSKKAKGKPRLDCTDNSREYIWSAHGSALDWFPGISHPIGMHRLNHPITYKGLQPYPDGQPMV